MHLPTSSRVAKLILPNREEIIHTPGQDWVYAKWYSGPEKGTTRKLFLESSIVGQTTVTIQMSNATKASNFVVPLRLDGLRVGPLQTLTGPHEIDDIYIRIEGEVQTVGDVDIITSIPVRVPAPFVCLCLVVSKSGEDRLNIKYFDKSRGSGFSKPGTVIVRTTPARQGLISLDDMIGKEWYLYSEPGDEHTVIAIEPRDILKVGPPTASFSTDMKTFLNRYNWNNTGHLAVDGIPHDPKEGDIALVIHLFGGKSYNPVLVSGHFGLGTATVVRCPISHDLRYDLVYHQVYTHNARGIVSCSQTWATYRGDIKSGWHSYMPVSDAIVTAPELLECDGTPMKILRTQLEIVMSRYRSGDGTGISSISPASSCVQDSTQAVFLSLIRGQFEIKDPSCKSKLAELKTRIYKHLGKRIRPDWEHNSLVLEGTDFKKKLRYGILSWKTIVPRSAFDRYCRVFEGYPVLFIRDNGFIESYPPGRPSPPTSLFGNIPYMSELIRRPIMAGVTPPGHWMIALLSVVALILRIFNGKGLVSILLTIGLVPHPEDNEVSSWPFAVVACGFLFYITRTVADSVLPIVYIVNGSFLSLLLSLYMLDGIDKKFKAR